MLGQTIRRRRIFALVESPRDFDQRPKTEIEVESRLVLNALFAGAQDAVQPLEDVGNLDAQEDDHPHDFDGDQENDRQPDRAVDQIEPAMHQAIGVQAERDSNKREQQRRDRRSHRGSLELHVRRRDEPEQHRERDKEHDDRHDPENHVVLEKKSQEAVFLQHAGGREGETHQDRAPEKEHRERHDFLAIAAAAGHFPDLIDGRLDSQEKAERDDDEDDHAKRRSGLRVLGEPRQVISQDRRLIGDDDVEDAVDLALKIRKQRSEVLLQYVRECHQQRNERQ